MNWKHEYDKSNERDSNAHHFDNLIRLRKPECIRTGIDQRHIACPHQRYQVHFAFYLYKQQRKLLHPHDKNDRSDVKNQTGNARIQRPLKKNLCIKPDRVLPLIKIQQQYQNNQSAKLHLNIHYRTSFSNSKHNHII